MTAPETVRPDPHAVLYTPDGPVRLVEGRPPLAVWRLTRETWASRDMVMRLVRRDVQSRYRQFYLGAVWLVLNPAITIAVFLVLNRTGVLNVGAVPVPYPLFALVGITIWQFFTGGVGMGTNSLVAAGPLLIKVNVPKASLVIASLGTTVVDFVVRLGFIVVVYAVYGLQPPAVGLLAIVALIPLAILTVAISLLQSVLGVVVRDLAALLPTLLSFLVFLMPVYYETPSHPIFARLMAWNPLYHLVIGPRDLLLRGTLPSLTGFTLSTIGAILLLAFAARFFASAQYKIAERA